MIWNSGSGKIKLSITKEHANRGYHQGQCDEDIKALLKEPSIAQQFSSISYQDLVECLSEYGAWDEVELSNRHDNEMRLLWIACADLVEDQI